VRPYQAPVPRSSMGWRRWAAVGALTQRVGRRRRRGSRQLSRESSSAGMVAVLGRQRESSFSLTRQAQTNHYTTGAFFIS
jgi:hypothetical protein